MFLLTIYRICFRSMNIVRKNKKKQKKQKKQNKNKCPEKNESKIKPIEKI